MRRWNEAHEFGEREKVPGRIFCNQTKAWCIWFSDHRITHRPCINTKYFYLNIILSPYLVSLILLIFKLRVHNLSVFCKNQQNMKQRFSSYSNYSHCCWYCTMKHTLAKKMWLTYDTLLNVTCNVSVVWILQNMRNMIEENEVAWQWMRWILKAEWTGLPVSEGERDWIRE